MAVSGSRTQQWLREARSGPRTLVVTAGLGVADRALSGAPSGPSAVPAHGERRRSRRLAWLFALCASGVGSLVLAASASASPTASLTAGLEAGARLGEAATLTANLAVAGSEYNGHPLPLAEVTLRTPKGTSLTNTSFPTCAASVLEPSGVGPRGCPYDSRSWDPGSFTAFVWFSGEYHEEHGTTEVFFSPEGRVTLFMEGHSPVSLEVVAHGEYLAPAGPSGPGVKFVVPQIETVPSSPHVSFTALSISLGAFKEHEEVTEASVTAPVACSSGLSWEALVKLSDGKGSEATAGNEATSACPSSGKRVRTTTEIEARLTGEVAEEPSFVFTTRVAPRGSAGASPTGSATLISKSSAICLLALAPAGLAGEGSCERVLLSNSELGAVRAQYSGDASYAPSEANTATLNNGPAKRKAEEEAAARRKGEEEAAVRKHAEEEVAAKKRAEEATARRHAEEEAAAHKHGEEEAALASQAKSALTEQLAPRGKGAKLASLRKAGGYIFSFSAPTAGTLTISWYVVPKGARLASARRPVLVATAAANASKPGSVKVDVKLTAKGKQLLRHAGSVTLTAKGSFTPLGKPAVITFKTFTIKP